MRLLKKCLPVKEVSFICLLWFSVSPVVLAQDMEYEQAILPKSWEVGTDLLWLINKNQLPPSNIFVRRNLETQKGTRHGWRLRVGADVSIRDSVNVTDPIDNELNETYLLLQIGHEWQYSVSEKALLYFGADLSFSFKRRLENKILGLADPRLSQDTKTIYSWLIRFSWSTIPS